jgi:hypothetical protein
MPFRFHLFSHRFPRPRLPGKINGTPPQSPPYFPNKEKSSVRLSESLDNAAS